MTSKQLVLPGLPKHPIPGDQIQLLVEVNRECCAPPEAIEKLDQQWLDVSLIDLVACAAMYFTDRGTVVGEGETLAEAKMRRAWHDLMAARPTPVEVDGQRRLIFESWDEPDEQGRASMLVGEAVAIWMTERMFEINRTSIVRVAGRHDHEFLGPEGLMKLEARARFNRNGRSEAIAVLDQKFGQAAHHRSYARSVAVLAYPSDHKNRRTADVEILDPEGDAPMPTRADRIRVVLRHFLQYASGAYPALASLYTFLLSLADDELLSVYALGSVLDRTAPAPRQLAGDAVMQVGDATYLGHVMKDFVAPSWLPLRGPGVVFVGVWDRALEATLSSTIEALLHLDSGTQTTMDEPGTLLARFSDGTLFAWAPDEATLTATGLHRVPGHEIPPGTWRRVGPTRFNFVSGPQYSVARSLMSTVFHAAYWAHSLRLAHPRDQVASLTRSLGNARVDLNPHQIDAALFALRSPYSRGVLLADEVGLGKTIEASLVMAQKWAERRRRLLLIAPATLRKQWQLELAQKFFLPSTILETKAWNDRVRAGTRNPFDTASDPRVVICSYQFAYAKRAELNEIGWDLVVVDEAHRLRNIFKGTKTAVGIAEAIAPAHKILLTATPLQNSLLELHGLVSILDPDIFGDLAQFQSQFVGAGGFATIADRDSALRARISPVCKRTLRRDVAGFVKFTNRFAVTAEFTNTATEQQLYDEVSAFLQREELLVLPSGQRPLLTLVLRKLLASSTRAIGATLAKFVARVEGDELRSDYEVGDDPAGDDPSREIDDPVAPTADPVAPKSDGAASAELSDLRRFIALAESVARDSKAEQLLSTLPGVLEQAVARGAKRKAVIFTESCKTQMYLAELLGEHGYAGQIVLMNGTNTDPISRSTYQAYKARHQPRWADVTSGSKTADMKAAIVEEFEDRGTILLATESAAEGVNLQFCSVVMNYDLPWNPQRIEQRIGRCHRYGQRSEVLVVNFVNKSNQADVRVYELLEKKLCLFEGVFGTSDEVLGATAAAGMDLERAIADIYQQCRTDAEIDRAFDDLQTRLDDVITAGRGQARQTLLDHFDADIHERLRIHRDQAKTALDEQQQQLLDLVRFAWGSRATFAADAPRFTLDVAGVDRTFNLDWKDAAERDEEFFRVDHELAVELIDSAARTQLPPQEVVFTYARHASALADRVGARGWLELVRLSVTALDRPEQFLLIVACDDKGREVPVDVATRLFTLDGRVGPLDEQAGPPPDTLATLRGVQVRERVALAEGRSRQLLEEEGEKIERRTQDQKEAVARSIAELESRFKAAQRAARSMVMLEEQIEANRHRDALKRELDAARRNQYDEVDRLENQAAELTEQMQRAVRERTITETVIATLRWRLVHPENLEA